MFYTVLAAPHEYEGLPDNTVPPLPCEAHIPSTIPHRPLSFSDVNDSLALSMHIKTVVQHTCPTISVIADAAVPDTPSPFSSASLAVSPANWSTRSTDEAAISSGTTDSL